MTAAEHQRIVNAYRADTGKPTPAQHMAYLWSRQALGERLSAGQRGFLAASMKPSWHGQPVDTASVGAAA